MLSENGSIFYEFISTEYFRKNIQKAWIMYFKLPTVTGTNNCIYIEVKILTSDQRIAWNIFVVATFFVHVNLPCLKKHWGQDLGGYGLKVLLLGTANLFLYTKWAISVKVYRDLLFKVSDRWMCFRFLSKKFC